MLMHSPRADLLPIPPKYSGGVLTDWNVPGESWELLLPENPRGFTFRVVLSRPAFTIVVRSVTTESIILTNHQRTIPCSKLRLTQPHTVVDLIGTGAHWIAWSNLDLELSLT